MTLLREAVDGEVTDKGIHYMSIRCLYMFETREELLRHLVIYDLLRSSIL
jgi:hypothetical protein